MIITLKTYVHSDKECNWEYISQIEKEHNIKLSYDMKDIIKRLNYEIELIYEINTDQCNARLIEVEGQKIQ